MAWARSLLLFCFFGGAPQAPSRCVCLVASRLPEANFLFFLLSGLRRQRFGTFCGYGLAWLGHESCCCSAFSEALLRHLFDSVSPGGLLGSVGNVSVLFVVTVSHGLGTNLAAVLLFRRRSSGTCLIRFRRVACCCSAFSKALP